MKNNLPKYWVVKSNTNNPNWQKVIDYLKNVVNFFNEMFSKVTYNDSILLCK